ncbi:hypothetical protein [Micromonospora sp. NBRC 107095]|uniref:hypothetical protein n=1 Tax=Micromonospora sp. NBRC 107095 TaxID=3032209 RepID=UPI0024A05812|nr:hypothetical protein Misp05_51960 [Micromonospora sp. NBRC 107095]
MQFTRPIFVRVIRVLDWPTYDGWLWLDGYELSAKGAAVARRSLFVMSAGLIWPDTLVRATRPSRTGTPARRGPVTPDSRVG